MLKYGLVGGGNIGEVHKRVASFDGLAEMVCGCFSSNKEKNFTISKKWKIDKVYENYTQMANNSKRDELDFVVIATPNGLHYDMAKEFANQGINVMCEKPMTTSLEDAYNLKKIVEEKKVLLCVNYTYSGYPMIRQAKRMIENKYIGEIIKVVCEYKQDTNLLKKLKSWKLDENLQGCAYVTSDIGTHIEYLSSFITGLKISKISSMFSYINSENELETDFSAMLRYENGASGIMWSSKVCAGENCNIDIQVMGTLGMIHWSHLNPHILTVKSIDKPTQIYEAGKNYLYEDVIKMSRLSSGHIEGYHDANANIYNEFIRNIEDVKNGSFLREYIYPTVLDGISGVSFVLACVRSANNNCTWVNLDI